jgi:hypothetical protein
MLAGWHQCTDFTSSLENAQVVFKRDSSLVYLVQFLLLNLFGEIVVLVEITVMMLDRLIVCALIALNHVQLVA